jgi:hypothetical protein
MAAPPQKPHGSIGEKPTLLVIGSCFGFIVLFFVANAGSHYHVLAAAVLCLSSIGFVLGLLLAVSEMRKDEARKMVPYKDNQPEPAIDALRTI